MQNGSVYSGHHGVHVGAPIDVFWCTHLRVRRLPIVSERTYTGCVVALNGRGLFSFFVDPRWVCGRCYSGPEEQCAPSLWEHVDDRKGE